MTTALGAAVLIHLSAVATHVKMEHSIDHPILDDSTVSAFRRWHSNQVYHLEFGSRLHFC